MDDDSYENRREAAPEHPRSEPEIIPPRRGEAQWRGVIHTRVWTDEFGRRYRAVVATPGPFSIILALLIVGFVAALGLLFLLGLVVVWIPILVAAIVVFLLSAGIRSYWARLRGR